MDKDIIHLYTAGCSNVRGDMGIGIYMEFNGKHKEFSSNIGTGDEKVANLNAILFGISQIKDKKLPTHIYTDSQFCINALSFDVVNEKEEQIVSEIKDLMKQFDKIVLYKVSVGNGDYLNAKTRLLAFSQLKQVC